MIFTIIMVVTFQVPPDLDTLLVGGLSYFESELRVKATKLSLEYYDIPNARRYDAVYAALRTYALTLVHDITKNDDMILRREALRAATANDHVPPIPPKPKPIPPKPKPTPPKPTPTPPTPTPPKPTPPVPHTSTPTRQTTAAVTFGWYTVNLGGMLQTVWGSKDPVTNIVTYSPVVQLAPGVLPPPPPVMVIPR